MTTHSNTMSTHAMANNHDERPEALDLARHFSRATKKRAPNQLKDYYKFLRAPGMGNFAGGLPCSRYFPFQSLGLSVPQPGSLLAQNGSVTVSGSAGDAVLHLNIPRRSADTSIRRVDLDTSMQYGGNQGYAPLYAWLRKLVNDVYHPNIPYKGGAGIMITCGSSDGLSKVYELLFNYWDEEVNAVRDREGLLLDEFVYGPPVAQISPRDVNIVPVKTDEQGMLAYGPGGLFECLDNWDYSIGKRPHVVYLIPTGHNPTSRVLSLPRRRQIYEVCSHFDVIIIEDDPYWNLYYPSADTKSKQDQGASNSTDEFPTDPHHNYCTQSLAGKSTGYQFLDELVPSFLSIDTDGRVIRLDTFSKTISPGCRLGWITAQPHICEQIYRIIDGGSQQPSGFSQAIVTQLIADFSMSTPSASKTSNTSTDPTVWGLNGWVKWIEDLRTVYQRRMVTMSTILEDNRFTTSAEDNSKQIEMFNFTWPKGGMFLWLRMNVASHPLAPSIDPARLMLTLWILCTQAPYQVLIVPGGDFAVNTTIKKEQGFNFFRFCFAAVDEGILEAKSHAFINACRDFWAFREIEQVERVLQQEGLSVKQASAEFNEFDREPVGEW